MTIDKKSILLDQQRAWETADAKDRQTRARALLRSDKSLGLTDKQVDALSKIISQPGELGALAAKSIVALQEKNAQQVLELQREWANAYVGQGKSIAGIAAAARAIGAIAAFFGFHEFQDMLNKEADIQMAKADEMFVQARAKMQEDTGFAADMGHAGAQAIGVATSPAVFKGTEAAVRESDGADVPDPYDDGSPAAAKEPAGKAAKPQPGRKTQSDRGITLEEFRQSLVEMGVDAGTVQRITASFVKDGKISPAGEKGVVDTPVEKQALSNHLNSLTPEQQAQLRQKLNLPAPQPA